MKILLVHEYYRSSSPSGEDKVFEREKQLLEGNGCKVETLLFKNDFIGTVNGPSVLKTALYTPYSPLGKKMMKNALNRFKPDVVHFHNTFPVLSQAAIIQAKKMGIATVQTLHNFRTVCAEAMLMRDGALCDKCLFERSAWYALKYRCYRGSFFATLPLFMNITLHQCLKTWQTKVDRIVTLSEFNRQLFIRAGFPENKLRVKPNFFFDACHPEEVTTKKNDHWVFIGRLKEEKGIQFLPEVWKKLGNQAPILHVIGDGPMRDHLCSEISALELENKIILHGLCPPDEVKKQLNKSTLLVFPSICYEGFPLVIGEAYAAGVAVAASKLGTPSYIVRDRVTGVHFQPGNVENMTKKLSELMDDPTQLIQMGKRARKEFEKEYTEERNFQLIHKIYMEAIQENMASSQ